ncbi:MAG: autotransporter outer membrane beta-barrel domain-containing protein [Alphaproteobacteria bacterium]|nr:autotransporter outer membrane beta-barrel domain-containing protein [Alphaproteobacteria bacterium]
MFRRLLSLFLAGTILSGVVPAFADQNIVVNAGEEGLYPPDAEGHIFKVQEKTHLTNYGNFQTTNGDVFRLDTHPDWQVNLSGSTVDNYGQMTTDGTGHAVYAYPLNNQRATTIVTNRGTMDRIDLSSTGKSDTEVSIGKGSSVFNYGTINGSVRMGTNAVVENFGVLRNKDNDDKENFYVNNLVYFDKNGVFRNGLQETLLGSGATQYLTVDLTPTATVTTDNIYFNQSGTLYNAGTILNKSITAADTADNEDAKGVKIYLMANPYYETDSMTLDNETTHLKYFEDEAVGSDDENPVLDTETMSLGDKATLRADQGSTVNVSDTFTVGKDANIEIGADYYWRSNLYKAGDKTYNWDRKIIVEKEVPKAVQVTKQVDTGEVDEDGNPIYEEIAETKYIADIVEEERSLNAIPMASNATIKSVVAGENGKLTVNNTYYTGENISMADKGQMTVIGSDMALATADKTGAVRFAKNGQFNLSGYYQNEVSLSDDNTVLKTAETVGDVRYVSDEYERSVVAEMEKPTVVDLDDGLYMDEGANLTFTGIENKNLWTRKNYTHSILSAKNKVQLGNNSKVSMGGGMISDSDSYLITWQMRNGVAYFVDSLSPQSLDIILGDNATISTVDQTTNAIVAKSLTFGNAGHYETAQPWDIDGDDKADRPSMLAYFSEKVKFGDDGYFFNGGSALVAKQLNMGNRAALHIGNTIQTEAIVGTDSNVYLHPLVEKGASNGITNGLFRQPGAININVYSQAQNLNEEDDVKKIYNENFLLNGVDVDHIYVQSGGLRLGTDGTNAAANGDIHGDITMSSDTWLRFTGNNVKIYDPIKRADGAKNTLVWIDVNDAEVIDTRNTIDSDTLMIGGGTLNVNNKVTATDVVLDDAGGLRVYDSNLLAATVPVHEYESSAANTTLFIAPKTGVMDSFGTVQVDRLFIENGTFNARHAITARGNDARTSTEGIWFGSNATLNVYNQVNTSRLMRAQNTAETIVNTTATVNSGALTVEQSADIDQLTLNGGVFNFKNTGNVESTGLERNARITNDVTVGPNAIFLANGTDNPNSGRVIIGNGSGLLSVQGRLGLSLDSLGTTGTPGIMNLNANLKMASGSVLDLRTSDSGNDKIHASGTADLSDRVRLIVRDLKENTSYHLMTADSGLNLPGSFATSFLWHDTDIGTPDGHNLYLNVGHISTLREELEKGNVSKNILAVGGYMSDVWDGSYGAWDDVFFATSLSDATKVIAEYVPEGYINAPHMMMRAGATFRNMAGDELADMRQMLPISGQRTRIAPNAKTRRPAYYTRGRAGGDRPMYQPYVRQRIEPDMSSRRSVYTNGSRGGYRTDKGGIWAKPFYLTMTQDADRGISGYDYDSYGLAVGVDRRMGRWTVGLSGLYAQGDFEQDNKVIEADVDTWGVGLYGSYHLARVPVFVDLFASYIHNSNEAKHKIKSAGAVLKADYDTDSMGAGFAVGYDISFAGRLFLTPKIGFNYARLSSDDVNEKGIAPIIMRVKNPDINSLQLPVEVRMAFPIATRSFELMPEMHFRYTHDFGDTDYQSKAYIQGTDVVLKLDNVGLPENLFTLGGSLAYTMGAHELSGRYDFEFGDGLSSHLFNVGYKYLF